MENPTQFDLNATIERWRENLSRSPQFRPENLQELESHLRDSISAWQAKGLSDEESFHIATRRLGAAPTLEPEFEKVNGKEVWLDRLLWMAIGVQLFGVLSSLSTSVANLAVIGGLTGFGYHFRTGPWFIMPGILMALIRLLILALAIWGCWVLVQHKRQRLSTFAGQILRRPFLIGLAVLASSIIPRFLDGYGLLLLKWFSMGELGAIGLSVSTAGMVIFLVTAITLAALTVFLARRRLRLRTNR